MRGKLKNRAKKAQKQQRRSEEVKEAAPRLMQSIHEAVDEEALRAALTDAERLKGLAPLFDEVITEGRERLQRLEVETRAARKAANMEVGASGQCCDTLQCLRLTTFHLVCMHMQEHMDYVEALGVAEFTSLEEQAAAADGDKKPAASAEPDEDDDMMCSVCLVERKDHVFVPCGHVCACEKCVSQIRNTERHVCPMCRSPFTSAIRFFL